MQTTVGQYLYIDFHGVIDGVILVPASITIFSIICHVVSYRLMKKK